MRPRPDRRPSRHPAGETRRSWLRRGRRVPTRPGLEALESRELLSATNYTVNSTGNSTAGSGTSGTLPYVISLANADTNPDGSEVTFDPTVFSSPQTIALGATLMLNESPGPKVIDGPGDGLLVVAGEGDFGIFSNLGTATLSGLIITGGEVEGPYQEVGGVLNQGTLTLLDCTISGNRALKGGGITNYGVATLTGCTISNNVAVDGGGLYNGENAVATLNQCTINGNSTYGNGGGVYSDTATATLNQCTISGNSAGKDGGGLSNGDSATTTLSQCTISGNSAGNTGGGLSNAMNATASLIDTIVAGNTISGDEASDIATAFGAGVTGTYNLIGPGGSGGIVGGTGGNIVLTDLNDLDLGPLAQNGGPDETMALLPDSVAINAGTPVAGVTTGQQGFPMDSPPDIGAYQVGMLDVSSISAISPNPRNIPVDSVLVTLNKPAGPDGFGISALYMAEGSGYVVDCCGTNLINGGVTVAPVSGSTYLVSGLSALNTAEGDYFLTVDTTAIKDVGGNPGDTTVSTKWMVDTTPPTSSVDALPSQTTSTSFTVNVTASDPSVGASPSGLASIAIYDSVNGGPFALFTTVSPSDPSAVPEGQYGDGYVFHEEFTGQAGDTYAFYSVATDQAGNIQPTPASPQATTTVAGPTYLGMYYGLGPILVVGQEPVFVRKLNKTGKPVGKPVLSGFTLEFNAQLDAGAANDPANYQVDTFTAKRVKKKLEHILHPIPGFTVSYDATDDGVTIRLAKPEEFPKGGQITVLGGVTDGSGGSLFYTNVFAISRGGKSIAPG